MNNELNKMMKEWGEQDRGTHKDIKEEEIREKKKAIIIDRKIKTKVVKVPFSKSKCAVVSICILMIIGSIYSGSNHFENTIGKVLTNLCSSGDSINNSKSIGNFSYEIKRYSFEDIRHSNDYKLNISIIVKNNSSKEQYMTGLNNIHDKDGRLQQQ